MTRLRRMEASIAALEPVDTEEESAHHVWLAWEKLRVVYNLVLGAETLVLGGKMFTTVSGLEMLVLGALGANVCFCAGPVLEGYLRALKMPRRIARWLLFLSGMFIAVVAALIVLLSASADWLPNQS